MVKPAKLYERLTVGSGGVISFRDFEALVKAFGFEHIRSKGSHRSYHHPDCPELLVIQPKGSDAKRYQVREFLDLVEEYGLHMR